MKRFRIQTTLTLFACFALTASLGCASSNDSSTGCGALSACCATLTGEEQSACDAVANAADVTDADCTQELSMLSSVGVCTSIAQGDSEGGSAAPAMGGSNGSSCPSEEITASACETLKSCCSELDVSQDPDTCITVAGEGTPEACSASLSTYQSMGTCTDVMVNCPVAFALVCHEVVSAGGSEACVSASVTGSTCPDEYTPGSCSDDGLVGCCVVSTGTSSGPELNLASCVYDDSEASALENECEIKNGTWTTVAP
jgi:hypothetical protein